MLRSATSARRTYAFTLVEVLIVVMLLAVLAMIAIPRFSSASDQARDSALATDLQTTRSQIEMYKTDHNGRGPQYKEDGNLDVPKFVGRLTNKTTVEGRIDNTNGTCGPYLREWPSNPFVPDSIAQSVKFGTGAAQRDDSSGWYFNTDTGILYPNSVEGP
jgi:prepilin-type N-terminal cleavage/methylation domain-containing protein